MKFASRIPPLFCVVFAATLLPAQVNFNYNFYQTSGQGLGAVTADFNRDGYPDVAVGTNNSVEVYLSTGNGNGFGVPHSYAISAQSPADMVTADFNGDGWPDLAILPSNGGTTVQIFLNNGDGTFRQGTPIILAAAAGNYISAGDVNNDGKVDLVIAELVSNGQADQFVVYKGNGNGTFTVGQVISLPGLASRPVLFDLNRDGKLDIAAAVNKNAEIFWGNGDGTFSAPTVIQESDSNGDNDLAVGDLNNDSNPDLVIETAQFCGSACGVDTVYTYLGDGAGHFTLKSSFVMNGISAGGSLFVADLNDDQNMDVVIENPEHFGGGVSYALGNGNGTFGTQGIISESDTSGFIARDFNLDSRPDIVVPTWMGDGFVFGVNTSTYTNCAPPNSATLQAKICVPAINGTVPSQFVVRGAGNSPLGVKRLEIWVDGRKITQELNSQIAKVITLSPGVHNLTLVAVDLYLGYSSVTERITVR